MSRDMTRQRAQLAIECAIHDLKHARNLVRELAPAGGRLGDADAQLDETLLHASQALASVKSR